MKKYKIGILALVALGLCSTGASATPTLYDYAFNANGDLTPSGIDLTSFNTTSGLGTISYMSSTDGMNSFLAFLDHEIDEESNTYFNENGDSSGTPAAGQSWEIDEPGYVFGDIYTNFTANTLENSNGVPAGSEDDVSMALGWDFTLATDEIAYITMTVSQNQPTSGFYLTQFDPDSQESLYFFSNLTIRGGNVPEPATMLLMGTGLIGLFGYSRRKSMHK